MAVELTPRDSDEEPDDDLEVEADALFADLLLRCGGRLGPELEQLCERRPELAEALREVAARWSGGVAPPPPPAPLDVEGFVVGEEIGRGGMAVVYEAEQVSPPRRVALKVVPGEWSDPDRAKRLELEGRVLAMLKHPSIVPLFGSGRTPDGAAWFAMELVSGRPVDDAARRVALSIDDRLVLFGRICDAIQYAHRKGIVHRDLKPSNILVDEESLARDGAARAHLRILDFGLARITDADLTLVSMPSDAGRIVGTLAYMSPEQVAGDPEKVDQQSDVYSLGVVLYELLAGRRPVDVSGCPVWEAARRVREVEVARPSRFVRGLPRDLDTIVLKALAKEPARRYPTAAALAEDVGRYLDGSPVLAHPASVAYQLAKLARRHRAAAAAALAIGLAVTSVGGVIAWHQHRTATSERRQREHLEEERRVAEAEARKAHAMLRFQQRILASAQPGQGGRDVRVTDVLAAAATEVEDAYAGEPDVEAAVRTAIGLTYHALGRYDAAATHLDAAARLLAGALGEGHADHLTALVFLGRTHQAAGDGEPAEALFRRALAGFSARGEDEHDDALSARANLALILKGRGELDEAEALLAEVLAARLAMYGEDDGRTAMARHSLGVLLTERGRPAEAAPLLRAAYRFRVERLGDDHPETLSAATALATLLLQTGEVDEALVTLEDVLARRRRVLGPQHPATVRSLSRLAAALLRLGRVDEAEPTLREVLAHERTTRDDDHLATLTALNNLAVALKDLGRLAEAEEMLRRVVDGRRAALGEDHPETLTSRGNLATLLISRERFSEAEEIGADVFDRVQRVLGADHPHLGTVRNTLAMALASQGKHDEAEALFRRALETRRAEAGDDHPDVLILTHNLANLLRRSGRQEEALVLIEESLARGEHVLAGTWKEGLLRLTHGCILAELDRPGEAETAMLSGYELLTAQLGDDSPNTVLAIRSLAELYRRLGLEEKAAVWQRRLDPPAE